MLREVEGSERAFSESGFREEGGWWATIATDPRPAQPRFSLWLSACRQHWVQEGDSSIPRGQALLTPCRPELGPRGLEQVTRSRLPKLTLGLGERPQ